MVKNDRATQCGLDGVVVGKARVSVIVLLCFPSLPPCALCPFMMEPFVDLQLFYKISIDKIL